MRSSSVACERRKGGVGREREGWRESGEVGKGGRREERRRQRSEERVGVEARR